MTLFHQSADVFVRPATAGDDEPITRIQLAAWQAAHRDVLGQDVIAALDAQQMRAQWAAAIERPPGPQFAVLVACAGPHVVGFAAVAPGQLLSLEVEPPQQRSGHGSRLLSASIDRLRSDGAEAVVTWILDGDEARQRFFAEAGLGPDGHRRTLAAGPREVVERRWSAAIVES